MVENQRGPLGGWQLAEGGDDVGTDVLRGPCPLGATGLDFRNYQTQVAPLIALQAP